MSERSFKTQLNRFDSDLWGHHFMVPMDVSAYFIKGKHKRLICKINGVLEFQCALMPDGGDRYFVNLNKTRCKKLKAEIGDELSVSLKPDTSKYGLPMPEELKAVLDSDSEGDRLFHALTPGKQRNLLYIAGQPKSSEIRIRKSLIMVEHLKRHHGKIDFKQLNEDFKMGRDPGV